MIELLLIWTAVMTIAAVIATFAYGGDAASPMGDGMVLGCLLLAVPLWPISMPFWLWYMISRHRDANS